MARLFICVRKTDNHLSGLTFEGTVGITCKYYTRLKCVFEDKHSSLFLRSISDEVEHWDRNSELEQPMDWKYLNVVVTSIL